MTMGGWPHDTALDGLSGASLRSGFIANVLAITGDTRLFWLPQGSDTTTSTDKSLNARTFTYDATIASRLSALGLGYAVSFSGTGQYATVPDAANLSFGDSSTDVAMSIISLVNPTDASGNYFILSKDDGSSAREYRYQLSSGLVQFQVRDQSAGVNALRASDASTGSGAWMLISVTYSVASGGATAANDMTIYKNGLSIASTATNNASYVAQEDLGSPVSLGALGAGTSPFKGSMAMVILCQKNLSASDHWAIKTLVNAYFGLSL